MTSVFLSSLGSTNLLGSSSTQRLIQGSLGGASTK